MALTEEDADNPFYRNYIFSMSDLSRHSIRRFHWFYLWILPTFVQFNDGYVFHYKFFMGRIFLVKIENICWTIK